MIAGIFSVGLISLNAVYALGRKHKKKIALVLLCFMWILFWGNYDNPDYNNYLSMYNSISNNQEVIGNSASQFGFLFLMKLGSLFNLSYNSFIAVITLICYFLIYRTVRNFTNNLNYIFLLYFIFPFFLDVIQFKNFIVMSLLIYSIKYLLSEEKVDKIKYILLILLASTIHGVAIFFILLALVNKFKNINTVSVSLFIFYIFCFSLIVVLNDKKIPFLNSIINLISDEKVDMWVNKKTNWGFLLFYFIQIYSFFMVYISRKLFLKNNLKRKNTQETIQSKYVNLVYRINLLAIIYLPFYVFASSFVRVGRNLVFFSYIVFAITNESICSRNEKLLYNFIIVLYILLLILTQIIPQKIEIVDSILLNNFIF